MTHFLFRSNPTVICSIDLETHFLPPKFIEISIEQYEDESTFSLNSFLNLYPDGDSEMVFEFSVSVVLNPVVNN